MESNYMYKYSYRSGDTHASLLMLTLASGGTHSSLLLQQIPWSCDPAGVNQLPPAVSISPLATLHANTAS